MGTGVDDRWKDVLSRGLMLFLILKFTAADFDGTEWWALFIFLSGDRILEFAKPYMSKIGSLFK